MSKKRMVFPMEPGEFLRSVAGVSAKAYRTGKT
jgi:hypothetical protein